MMTPRGSNDDPQTPEWSGLDPLVRSAALLSALMFAACAQVPTDPEALAVYEQVNDPAEPANRTVFSVNHWVDRNAMQPVAQGYADYIPDNIRTRLHNLTFNLKAPSILVNDVLQANFTNAWTTTQRFVVNTTIGGAGLFDVATDWGLPYHDADFGQTFGVWGAGPGPSVQLPLLGPSNIRDATGTVVGILGNPLGFVQGDAVQTIQMTNTGVSVIDQRAGTLNMTDDLEKNSVDYYASLRSIYAQRRQAFVEEGRTGGSRTPANINPVTSKAGP